MIGKDTDFSRVESSLGKFLATSSVQQGKQLGFQWYQSWQRQGLVWGDPGAQEQLSAGRRSLVGEMSNWTPDDASRYVKTRWWIIHVSSDGGWNWTELPGTFALLHSCRGLRLGLISAAMAQCSVDSIIVSIIAVSNDVLRGSIVYLRIFCDP